VKAGSNFVIRCRTPDCDWGFSTPDLGEIALNWCYSAFRKHCMEIHRLSQDNLEDAWVHFDIEHWILTLLK
jgi:hypothetical protein